MRLAANRPQVSISTEYEELRPFARRYQAAVNHHFKEMRLESTLQDIVRDAMFGIGIAKVFFAPGNPVAVPNPEMPPEPSVYDGPEAWAMYAHAQQSIPPDIYIDAGMPYVERVSLDDFCFDMAAKEWRKVRWMSHTYRIPLADLKSDDRIDERLREMIYPDSKWGNRAQHDGGQTANSAVNLGDPDDIEDMVTCMDVYFPREQTWNVVLAKRSDMPPLFSEQWRGPETGPFLPLTFHRVPDSIMPISMASSVIPLHDASNQLMRKVVNQAVNQKTILAYSGPDKDPKNISNAQDMQAVRVANPSGIREMRFNGADNPTVGFQQIIDSLFDRQAGNLHAMAGLGPMSSTASQDKLIHETVGGVLQLMGHAVLSFVEQIASNVGWMLWVDQTKRIQVQEKIPGMDVTLDVTWTPEDREGDFWQYNFNVEPYSMPYRSPQEKLQNVDNFIAMMTPLLPLIAQQEGGAINFQKLINYRAEMLNQPEFKELWTWTTPIPMDSAPHGAMPRANGVTRREYVKQSAPNPQQQRMDMAQNMMQQQPQQGGME
jgi:hypothetical protein